APICKLFDDCRPMPYVHRARRRLLEFHEIGDSANTFILPPEFQLMLKAGKVDRAFRVVSKTACLCQSQHRLVHVAIRRQIEIGWYNDLGDFIEADRTQQNGSEQRFFQGNILWRYAAKHWLYGRAFVRGARIAVERRRARGEWRLVCWTR